VFVRGANNNGAECRKEHRGYQLKQVLYWTALARIALYTQPTADAATVERVARALCKVNGCDPDETHEGHPLWTNWEDEALAAIRQLAPRADNAADALHIIFDGPPGPEAGRFVEVETSDGRSVNAGEWNHREDGYWELVIPRRR